MSGAFLYSFGNFALHLFLGIGLFKDEVRSRVYSPQYPVSLLYLEGSIKSLGILKIVVLINFMGIREGI